MFAYYLKLSWLSLKKTPAISFLMILAIAVGIGLTMTTLTVFHLMSANPIEQKSAQLYTVQLQTKDDASSDAPPLQLTYQDAMALRESKIPTRHTVMYKTGFAIDLENSGIDPFFEQARLTDRSFFSMFNIAFVHGGPWEESIDEVGVEVIVITQSLNEKLFGNINSVGKTLMLDNKPYTITGVIQDFNPAPKFYDLNNGSFQRAEKIYLPFSLTTVNQYTTWGNTNGWKAEIVDSFEALLGSELVWLQYWAELETKEQKEQFQTFLDNYIQDQKTQGRFTRNDAAAYLYDVEQWLDRRGVVGDDNRVLVGLGFLFLVVCLVNTIGLLLAKFLRRAPEVGVRRALGASQWEVFKHHIVEVTLIGLCGGVLGLVLSYLGLSVVRTLYSNYDRLTSMDVTMVLTTFVIAVISSILAGMYPAWRICRTNPAIHLKTQ